MNAALVFDPLAPAPLIAAAAAAALALCAFAGWLRSPAWGLRALGFAVLLLALANPALVRETRRALSDIAFVVVDETESQTIGDRRAEAQAAEADVRASLEALAAGDPEAPIESRTIRVRNEGGPVGDPGTRLLTALNAAAAEVPADRIAGAILITDGEIHDVEATPDFPAPIHGLITGARHEFDRRLTVAAAPAFGVVGERAAFRFSVEESGPPALLKGLGPARVSIAVDGETVGAAEVRPGREATLEVEIGHGGANVVELALAPTEGEITLRNNRAAFTVNGVRDRLRVLLVSGEPHAGERTWRNLLKADPSVDLVHFTILRPPTKQDGTPVFELSLIAFPTRELFLEKVDEFDLIIFDRYRRRGVLPSAYIANIARYVRDGGAVLIAAGPWFAGVESLYRTPLADILPVTPTSAVIEAPYTPRISETGARHPVTADLDQFDGGAGGGEPRWGRWLRQVEVERRSGEVLMTGVGEKPLLVLDHVGEGRVAVLASDHAWLWSRGYEGGGPQAELLRRLAHWLMKEPELEEEALSVAAEGARLTVTRRSVAEAPPERLEIVAPSGARTEARFAAAGPGRWRAVFAAEEQGLHRLSDGVLSALAAVGPPSPIEFERAVAMTDLLAPLAMKTRGGMVWLEDGAPAIRRVREGRAAAGRGWVGLARRGAYAVEDVRLTPLAPGWLMLVLAAGLMVGAWRIEGR
ncbi:glutamine amidotransferase [Pikeienuella sp. HZG-20]|uniref:glutamine amidotransferase n=1 Tax=Paludibacillus litoralis TaxID=3133267 RepID=UPI0030EB2BAA